MKRYRAYENGALMYETNSNIGMRDQAVRLLHLSAKCQRLTILDTVNDTRRYVSRANILDWRI